MGIRRKSLGIPPHPSTELQTCRSPSGFSSQMPFSSGSQKFDAPKQITQPTNLAVFLGNYEDIPWYQDRGKESRFETQSFLPILQLLPGLQINWQPSPRPFVSRQNISNHKHHFKLYEQVPLNRQKVAFTLGPCSIQPPQWPPSGHVPITSSLCQDASLAAEGAQLSQLSRKWEHTFWILNIWMTIGNTCFILESIVIYWDNFHRSVVEKSSAHSAAARKERILRRTTSQALWHIGPACWLQVAGEWRGACSAFYCRLCI